MPLAFKESITLVSTPTFPGEVRSFTYETQFLALNALPPSCSWAHEVVLSGDGAWLCRSNGKTVEQRHAIMLGVDFRPPTP